MVFFFLENLSSNYQAFAEDTWYSELNSYNSFPPIYDDERLFHNPRPPVICRPQPGE